MSLPHPLRPPVPVPVATPSLVNPTVEVAFLVLLVVVAIGWWWLRRQEPRRHRSPSMALSTWQELEAVLGAADWYERFGQRLCAMNGLAGADHDRTARLLSSLAAAEAGRPWLAVARRWEWAIYADHPGTSAEHRADLQLARARWP